ncbi:recombinase family protein [Burkholderia pseudomallei]|uniref:Recombinase n=1 Tax=Burkholderia ubonensis TaxID=101571 RepID=A0A1R1J877_9BURK|nr:MULTISPECIES: recombinase family protein [Burkholderia]MBO7826981.1 recombinase family protein [Burkholderia pseudomallei]MBO7863488.1 recombinase family protein [Burkholderia pseudomallei]MBO7876032.1 recombinase family protein [Burkholderia pseudomallei]OMG71378.1 recombinase [Burkholderia ubonensis]QTB79708.1 recombinase family protein [Burkholderia pseudomallei]
MNQRIGYARASAGDENLDLQRDALTRSGCVVVYEEIASGRTAGCPQWEQCRGALRPGDTLVVWRLDRLGHNLAALVRVVNELEEQGVSLESLGDEISTRGADGKPIIRVFAALAEFERVLIRERTHAGLAAARARGRSGGRKPKLDAQQIHEINKLMADPSVSVSQIAKRFKVSRTTIYKVAPTQKRT